MFAVNRQPWTHYNGNECGSDEQIGDIVKYSATALFEQVWNPGTEFEMVRALDVTLAKVGGDWLISGIAWCLEKWAEIALSQAQRETAARRNQLLQQAVRLFGAAASLRASVGSALDMSDQREQERHYAALRAELGDRAYATAWAEGPALWPGLAKRLHGHLRGS